MGLCCPPQLASTWISCICLVLGRAVLFLPANVVLLWTSPGFKFPPQFVFQQFLSLVLLLFASSLLVCFSRLSFTPCDFWVVLLPPTALIMLTWPPWLPVASISVTSLLQSSVTIFVLVSLQASLRLKLQGSPLLRFRESEYHIPLRSYRCISHSYYLYISI